MSAYVDLIRSRLSSISASAAAAAEALEDGNALDLCTRQLVEVLFVLDGMEARLSGVVDRLKVLGTVASGRVRQRARQQCRDYWAKQDATKGA
jgi:hypothetical protein